MERVSGERRSTSAGSISRGQKFYWYSRAKAVIRGERGGEGK